MNTKSKQKYVKIIKKVDEKTYTVLEETLIKHKYINKIIKKSKKYLVSSIIDDLELGATVKIVYTRPQSKSKSWTIFDKVEVKK